jgi:hypothetical protein
MLLHSRADRSGCFSVNDQISDDFCEGKSPQDDPS